MHALRCRYTGGRFAWPVLAVAALALLATGARAQVSSCATDPDRCAPGGGSATTDCVLEWRLPIAMPAGQRVNVVCYEGDPLCDVDLDIGNARCSIATAICINNNDPRLPTCAGSDVASLEVRKPSAHNARDAADAANLATLE